jgi:hypothetical protein
MPVRCHDRTRLVGSHLDNQKVAEVTLVGTLVSGYPALMTHCSMPMHVYFLSISGCFDPEASEGLREAFVQRVLDRNR